VSRRPAIDLHAHLSPELDSAELAGLGVVFAATRSLDEAETVCRRDDIRTIWGVGCHPGLVEAQSGFDVERFSALLSHTAYVSEVGLDGKSRVEMPTQRSNLDAILGVLESTPRITSLHSYAATEEVISALEARPVRGAVLHWWLGDERDTKRAVELGCFFSINASSVRRADLLALIPLDRILTETDHPFGNRRSGRHARPGLVSAVEAALADWHGEEPAMIRARMWRNLADLVGLTGCAGNLPRAVRRELMAS